MSSHSDGDVNLIVGALAGTAVIFLLIGAYVGNSSGHEAACKTVGLEWVKDKCMKVTREELK